MQIELIEPQATCPQVSVLPAQLIEKSTGKAEEHVLVALPLSND